MQGLIALVYDNDTYQADLATDENGFIRRDGGFESVVTASLYSWARDPAADTTDLPQKFGWWGSTFADDENDNYGSLLWTHRRGKNSPEERSRLERTLINALDWMRDDGVVQSITVEIERFDTQVVAAKVTLPRADGDRWDSIWEIQRNALQ